jgi:hypothetical protein
VLAEQFDNSWLTQEYVSHFPGMCSNILDHIPCLAAEHVRSGYVTTCFFQVALCGQDFPQDGPFLLRFGCTLGFQK